MAVESENTIAVNPSPEIIGITGGIGSGKSVVSRFIRLNGFPVYDCDSEAKRLMESNPILHDMLCDILGDEAYLEEGMLNKAHISKLIFSNDFLRARVNEVVHEAVRIDFLNQVAMTTSPVIFCESAILATSHMDLLCKYIWLIEAPEVIRIERVKQRNGISEDEIRKRIASQSEELSSLPENKIIRILNDNLSPLLPVILSLLPIPLKTTNYQI